MLMMIKWHVLFFESAPLTGTAKNSIETENAVCCQGCHLDWVRHGGRHLPGDGGQDNVARHSGSVSAKAVMTPHTFPQWLSRELEKRRQRQLLMGRVPALPKRYGVRESFVAFMCSVRHLQLAWFPKDIRQLLWRHFLKDAPSAPASQKVRFW
jgi:hypothetical protein